jgi:ATP-binding cassette subfamily B protein
VLPGTAWFRPAAGRSLGYGGGILSESTLLRSLRTLWRLSSGQSGRLVFAGVLGAVSALLALVPAAIVYWVALNVVGPNAEGLMIRPFVLWAVLSVEIRFALLFFARILARLAAVGVAYDLRVQVARTLGKVPLGFFNVHQSGALKQTVIEDVDGVQTFFADDFIEVLSAVAIPVAIVIGFFVVDWRLAIASLITYPLTLVVQRRLVERAQAQRVEYERARDRVNAATAEFTRAIVLHKSFGQSHESVRVLESSIEAYRAASSAQVEATVMPASLARTLTSSNLAVVIPLGLLLHGFGLAGLATLVFFGLFNLRLSGALLRLAKLTSTVISAGVSAGRLEEMLSSGLLADAGTVETPADSSIGFNAVTFRYSRDGSARDALQEITLSVPAGRVTAVVGLSGAGKTTLARLAARFWDVDRGEVSVGGSDVRAYRLERLMDGIAFVFQETYLLDDTIAENIRMGRSEIGDERIVAVAKAARAHEFISAMPEGYNTTVGRNGIRLSQGERQRLQIARALLKEAPILILDEATASTDPENEALIQDALAELAREKTVLVIAHRLSTVMDADKIVVMEAGRLVGEGTHAELLASNDRYRRLWHDYTTSFEWTIAAGGPAAAEGAAR